LGTVKSILILLRSKISILLVTVPSGTSYETGIRAIYSIVKEDARIVAFVVSQRNVRMLEPGIIDYVRDGSDVRDIIMPLVTVVETVTINLTAIIQESGGAIQVYIDSAGSVVQSCRTRNMRMTDAPNSLLGMESRF
jgi:hypothetical protein